MKRTWVYPSDGSEAYEVTPDRYFSGPITSVRGDIEPFRSPDGVMIEVHPDPQNAAVDPLQPIDYEEFKELMKKMDSVAKASYSRNVL